MADDDVIPEQQSPYVPTSEGMPTLPATPGDFSVENRRLNPDNPFRGPISESQAFALRQRLNFEEAKRQTLLGAQRTRDIARIAEAPAGEPLPPPVFEPDPGINAEGVPSFTPETGSFEKTQAEARDELQKMQADALVYKTMPGFKNFVELGAALSGQAAGAVTSPENFWAPEWKLTSAAWRAAHPIVSDIVAMGIGQALIQAIVDPVAQSAEIKAGLRKDYDPLQTGLTGVAGFGLGGAFGAVKHAGDIKALLNPFPTAKYFAEKNLPKLPPELEQPATANILMPATRPDINLPPGVTSVNPSPGVTRLFRAEQPIGGDQSHVVFSTDPAKAAAAAGPDGKVSYLDVRSTYAQSLRSGDDVTVPKAMAEGRRTAEPGAEAPVPPAERVQTFSQYIKGQGGVRHDADLASTLGKATGGLVKKKASGEGMTMAEVVEKAWEGGYLPRQPGDRPDDPGLFNKVREMFQLDQEGKHQYPLGQEPPKGRNLEMEMAENDVTAAMQNFGMDPKAPRNRTIFRDAADLLYTGEVKDAEDALERIGTREVQAGARGGRYKPPEDIPFDLGPTSEARSASEGAGGRGTGEAVSGAGEDVAGRRAGVETPGGERVMGAIEKPGDILGERIKNLTDIMRQTARALNMIVRREPQRPGQTASYNFDTHITTVSKSTSEGFIDWAHEMGHHVQAVSGKELDEFLHLPQHMEDLKAIAGPDALEGLTNETEIVRESFAHFMEAYITNRDYLRATAYEFTRDFQAGLARDKPELFATLEKAAAAYDAWYQAPARDIGVSITKSYASMPLPVEKDPLNRMTIPWLADMPLGKWADNLYRYFVDDAHPAHLLKRLINETYEDLYRQRMDLPPDKDYTIRVQQYRRGSRMVAESDLHAGVFNFNTMKNEGPSFNEAIRRAVFNADGTKPKDEFQALARLDEFNSYLIARWHLSLRRQIENGELVLKGPPSPLRDGQARMIVKELEESFPHWRAEAENIYDYQKALVQKQKDFGLISAEDYAFFKKDSNREYVPMRRDMTDFITKVRTTGIVDRVKLAESGMFRRTGSVRDVMNPLEQIVFMTHDIAQRAVDNDIVMLFADHVNMLVQAHGVGSPEAAAIMREIPNHQVRALDVDVEQTVMSFAMANGMSRADARLLAQEVTSRAGGNNRATLYSRQAIERGSEPIIFGWRNGERVAYKLADGELGRAFVNVIDSMGPHGAQTMSRAHQIAMGIILFPSAVLRTTATGTLTFVFAKNVWRDALGHPLAVPESRMPGADTLTAIKNWRLERQLGKKSDLTNMYFASGGFAHGEGVNLRGQAGLLEPHIEEQLGYSARKIQNARAEIARQGEIEGVPRGKNLFVKTLNDIESWAEFTEVGPRKGLFDTVFKANKAMGRTDAYAFWDAAHKARDIIDYQRRGEVMLGASRLIPFLNATIQGVDKFRRVTVGGQTHPGALIASKAATLTEAAESRKLLVRQGWVLAAAATLEAGLYYYNKDDPFIAGLSPEVRDTTWTFRVPFTGDQDLETIDGEKINGKRNGVYVSVPKVFEWGSYFNLMREIIQMIGDRDPNHINKFFSSLTQTFRFPSIVSSLPTANIAQIFANYDFYRGTPIVGVSAAHRPPHEQSNAYTGAVYKYIANALFDILPAGTGQAAKNIPLVRSLFSPMEMQWLVEHTIADFPKEIGGVGGIFNAIRKGETPDWTGVPIVRGWFKKTLGLGQPAREIQTQVGQNDGRLTAAYKEYASLRTAGEHFRADKYLDALDGSSRDYVLLKYSTAGINAMAVHPAERGNMLGRVISDMRYRLTTDAGLPLYNNPGKHIKVEPSRRVEVDQAMNELSTIEQRNSLIVQGVTGYKGQPLINTQPMLDSIKAMAPDVHKELVARMSAAHVLPIQTVEKYWPQMQKTVRIGASSPAALDAQLKQIGAIAASTGTYGGGQRYGRRAYGEGGQPVKRGKKEQVPVPAYEGASQ